MLYDTIFIATCLATLERKQSRAAIFNGFKNNHAVDTHAKDGGPGAV